MLLFCIYVLDILFAALFFVSLWNKLANVRNFSYEIASYKVLPSSLYYASAIVMIVIEFILILLFSSAFISRWTEVCTILVLIIFTILAWRKKRISGVVSCHCFGTKQGVLNRSPIKRNLVLIGFLVIRFFLPEREFEFVSFYNVLIFSATLSFIYEFYPLKSNLKRKVIELDATHDHHT